jgi:Family of unknown function (DUF5996)
MPRMMPQRFWRVLLQADRVFKAFRTSFIGKCSPIHFFWGSFDLAVTRFSGRRAPRHPGGVPNLSDEVACEAYSHEVSSAGFWPGGGGIDYPAFYSYAYPAMQGFRSAPVRPEAAFFSQELGEFALPYDAVRTAGSPDTALLDFLQSTPQPTRANGTAQHSNARRDLPVCRVQFHRSRTRQPMISFGRAPCDEGVIRAGAETPGCAERARPWVLATTILGSSMAFIDGSVVTLPCRPFKRI